MALNLCSAYDVCVYIYMSQLFMYLVVHRLVSLHQSVECALVLFNLRSVWSPSDDSSMKQLEKLVILSSDSAVACAYTATYLNRMRMAQGGSGGEPGGAPSEDKTPPVSFVELLQTLSCCVRRVAPTLPNMISIAVSVIKTAVSLCQVLLSVCEYV